MSDLDKTKIGFAIGLLAGLFTLEPLIKISTFSFILFKVDIRISVLYWIFVSLLSISVYFYALALIKLGVTTDFFQGLGNWTYAISLLFPPFVIMIYFMSIISNFITPILKSENIVHIINFVLGILTSVFAYLLVNKIQTKFKKDEIAEKVERIRTLELNSLEKAKTLFQSDYYDLVLIELWNILESSFKRVFPKKAIPFANGSSTQIIETIKKNRLLPENLLGELEIIKTLRNKSAHPDSGSTVTKAEADKAIKNTEKILIAIENYREQCYYCNKEFSLDKLEVEELNGDYYVCKNCIKEHPNWKNEILSMGMDP